MVRRRGCPGRYDVPAEVLCTDNDARLEPVDDRIRPVQGVASAEVFPILEMEELTFSRGTG